MKVCKLVSIEFAQMAKSVHICKWICFAISTFVIIEEMASVLADKNKEKSNITVCIHPLKLKGFICLFGISDNFSLPLFVSGMSFVA